MSYKSGTNVSNMDVASDLARIGTICAKFKKNRMFFLNFRYAATAVGSYFDSSERQGCRGLKLHELEQFVLHIKNTGCIFYMQGTRFYNVVILYNVVI